MRKTVQVNSMTVYSSLVVYPPEFDEIDFSICEGCGFECDVHGYCIKEAE